MTQLNVPEYAGKAVTFVAVSATFVLAEMFPPQARDRVRVAGSLGALALGFATWAGLSMVRL